MARCATPNVGHPLAQKSAGVRFDGVVSSLGSAARGEQRLDFEIHRMGSRPASVIDCR
jgi:hypothetical protein